MERPPEVEVYNPSKPNKFHIKLYQACKASSGYVSGFDIDPGDTECAQYADIIEPDQELGQTTRVVVGMCGLLDKGHKVYTDNYYSSQNCLTFWN